MGDKTNPSNLGAVVAIRGSVVDIRFDAHLPPIYSLLQAMEGKIAIEVLPQLDAHRGRGIALTPTQGLARGMAVEDTGGPLLAPRAHAYPHRGKAARRYCAASDTRKWPG
jgi:F-type H+/Na+-transporting ATPase subunit beta